MNTTIKLFLFVFLAFVGFTALLSAVMMSAAGRYEPLWLLVVVALGGALMAVWSIMKVIAINSSWKKQQNETLTHVWASWQVSGREWQAYKEKYLSLDALRKNARIYAVIAGIFFTPFCLLICSSIFELPIALLITLLASVLFFGIIYYVVLRVNSKKWSALYDASSATLKGNRDVLVFNDKTIYLKTPGLTVDSIRLGQVDGVLSVVIVLGMYQGTRRITQEHRIPYSTDTKETALAYFNRLAQVCGINLQ